MKNKTSIGYRMILLMIIIAISMLASVGTAYAITGTSGGITLNSGIGTISYDANSSNIDAYGLAEVYAGTYSTGTGITGRFGLGAETQSSGANISINLMSPLNDTATMSDTIDMKFNISGVTGTISSCSIYVDGSVQGVYNNLVPDSVQTLSVGGIMLGKHFWNVSCIYNSVTNSSKTWTFTRIMSSFVDGSTNFTQVNISAIPNLQLSSSGIGTIQYPGFTDLSSGPNLDTNVRVGYLSIFVNSTALPMLDKPATLTIYSIPYSNILILKDGVQCTDCTVISFNSGTLVFGVTGFSNYSVRPNSRLGVFDDSDLMVRHADDNVTFYANYTNATNSAPITSAACTISFNIGGWTAPVAMTYNSSDGLYHYYRSFNDSISSFYNVSCTNGIGFENIALTDSFTIASGLPTTFADTKLTFINSSRTSTDTPAANLSTVAGNVTELNVDAKGVSSAWQGYFGNVTGTLILADSNNNSLYNWDMASPHGEIYASRTTAVKWYEIRCANSTQLGVEDTYLGMDSTYAESIQKTFQNTTGFAAFYAGEVSINQAQGCYATNLYNSTGQPSAYYSEILLTDGANMVYTGLITKAADGFDSKAHDFEMLVGENGHDGNTESTMYYFYVEMV